MFDRGFGPDIRKFLGPLKNRASKPDGQGFQNVLVSATMTKVCYVLSLLIQVSKKLNRKHVWKNFVNKWK